MLQNASTIERTDREIPVTEARKDVITLPIRWIVPRIGGASADEAETAFSYGEPQCLIKEATELCAAFHPTNQLHTFPRKVPVFLFWQSQTTSDWVVTRVTIAPGATTGAASLEYFCLVFDDSTFHALRYNPFRTRSLNFHDRLRTHLVEQRSDAFVYVIPRSAVPTSRRVVRNPRGASEARDIPGISDDCLANADNFRAIQEYCGHWSETPAPPPTFATWWGNEGSDSERYFDLILRAPVSSEPTLDEIRGHIATLTADLKSAVPGPAFDDVVTVEQIQSILGTASAAETAIARTIAYGDVATEPEFRAHITELRLNLTLLSTRIESLVTRLDTRLLDEEAYHLSQLSERSQDVAHLLLAARPVEKAVNAAGKLKAWSLLPTGWLNRRGVGRNR